MTIPSEALRKCTQCGEEKPLAEYYFRKSGRGAGTPHAACKECSRAKVRDRKRGKDRERVLALDRKSTNLRRQRIKEECFNAYGGYKCVCCGEAEPNFLTLDHINNDGGEFRKKEFGRRNAAGYFTYAWLRRNGYPPEVQVMCMNCQHGKLMNDGVCPHLENV